MSFIGELLMAEVSEDILNATTVSTPWFQRQGNNLNSTFQIMAIGGSDAAVTVVLYSKNGDETGGGSANTPSGGDSSGSTADVYTFRNTNCKELVRYQVTLATASDTPTGTYTMFAIVRILAPAWERTGA